MEWESEELKNCDKNSVKSKLFENFSVFSRGYDFICIPVFKLITSMEDELDALLRPLTKDDKICGMVISDKQGLSIKTAGNAQEEASGIITAIVNIVSKLEPNQPTPNVILESENKCCIIHAGKQMNAAIFKNIPP